jgi:membrane protein YdbS with pleckstrin-like domain
MDEKGKTTGNRVTHATILLVIGIILFIIGIIIVTVHGAPLRGSGVGTIAIIAGIILLVISALRFRSKRAIKDDEIVKKP